MRATRPTPSRFSNSAVKPYIGILKIDRFLIAYSLIGIQQLELLNELKDNERH